MLAQERREVENGKEAVEARGLDEAWTIIGSTLDCAEEAAPLVTKQQNEWWQRNASFGIVLSPFQKTVGLCNHALSSCDNTQTTLVLYHLNNEFRKYKYPNYLELLYPKYTFVSVVPIAHDVTYLLTPSI